jgi:hypothetical protein
MRLDSPDRSPGPSSDEASKTMQGGERMSDSPGKFLGFLDQLLPFLAACPPWLRLWVHVLILINFVTIAGLAIVYLRSKEKAIDEGSLAYFSILTPANSQQIPLDENGAWMLTGTLPKAKDADFTVQVLKLPGGQSIPQTGQKIKSSFDGQWSLEPAQFDGYGTYVINVTGLLNGDSLVRTVTVTCYDKATIYKISIDREMKFRPGANVEPLPAGAISQVDAIKQLQTFQNDFGNALFAHQPPTNDDLESALATVNQGLDLVDAVLPLSPEDINLQNFRAFLLKDYAQVAQSLKRPEAQQALDEAKLMFEAVMEQDSQDTNVWNGLGSVYLLNGQPSRAVFYIRRALQLAPDNVFAQHDLAYAMQQIAAQKQASAGK